jgi:hypothetical protein
VAAVSHTLQVLLGMEAGFLGVTTAVYFGIVQGRARRWLARREHRPDPGPSAYLRRRVATGDKFLAVIFWVITAGLLAVCWEVSPVVGVIATGAADAGLFLAMVERARYADALRRAETAEALRENGSGYNAPDKEN